RAGRVGSPLRRLRPGPLDRPADRRGARRFDPRGKPSRDGLPVPGGTPVDAGRPGCVGNAVASGTRGTLLVVDDDKDIVDAVAAVLGAQGYHVLLAANGLEALRHLQSGARPDVIL